MPNISLKIKKSKSSLRRRLFVIMLNIALIATIICIVVFGVAFAQTLSVSRGFQNDLTQTVHKMFEIFLYQNESHTNEIYVIQQAVYLSNYIKDIEESGGEADWNELIIKAYSFVNDNDTGAMGRGIYDSFGVIQFVYADDELFVYSKNDIEKDEFISISEQHFKEIEAEKGFLESLKMGEVFKGETMGENSHSLICVNIPNQNAMLGIYISLTASDASDALKQLMMEESAIVDDKNTQSVYFVIIILSIFVALEIMVLIFVSRKMSNAFVTPVEYELLRAAEEKKMIEKINNLKTEFLGNVAHELKTPLTIVSGYAQDSEQRLLNNNVDKDNEVLLNQMKLISSEAERLALMVSQILDITRIDEGRMSINQINTSITTIIQRTVEAYYPVLNKNNNKLKLDLAYDLPNVYADSDRISQVIVNLLSNAIRHTNNGKIVISTIKEKDFVAVSITDNGAGISEEMLTQLFERYKSGGSGTGLGLFICEHIVTAHGGKINVESKQNEGTCVKFTLPISN